MSSENGIADVLAFVGKPLPEVYCADLSEFVFAAGVTLLETFRPDLTYLSTTDYVQHKAAPGSEVANAFYAMVDRYVGELDAAGCTFVMTADYGMNDKHLADGRPDVAHHGALGSFATVYVDAGSRQAVIDRLSGVDGVEVAISAEEACALFELPAGRIGDVVVLSSRHKVLGTTAARHDLTGLDEPLRSHGGLTEQLVPMISNRPVAVPPGRTLRNFDVFDVALNLVQ